MLTELEAIRFPLETLAIMAGSAGVGGTIAYVRDLIRRRNVQD